MVEVRELVVLGEHAAPGVEKKYNLLIAFILIFACNQSPHSGRRFPVDRAQAVAFPIVTQLVKFDAFTAAATQADPGKVGLRINRIRK